MAKTDIICIDRMVINRISEAIICYNTEGHFIALFPTNELPLPEYESGKVYVVNSDEYQLAKKSGRPTTDLVRITRDLINSEIGRGGVRFSYLEAYEGPGVRVKVTPCSLSSYERNDPKCMCHQLLNA